MPDEVKTDVANPETELDTRRAVFQQEAVEYTTLSSIANQACANCQFFHARDEYDPCAIVHDWPKAIQSTGWCDRWEAIPESPLDDLPDEVVPVVIVTEAEMDDMRSKPGLRKLLDRLLPKQEPEDTNWFDSPSGFRMLENNEWVGWWSNNFRDYYGTIFSEQGLDDYIWRVENELIPLPKLRSFHTLGTDHGVAKKVFRAGHFAMAYGEFYPDTENEQAFYREHQDEIAMSHGFNFDPTQFVDGVFYSFNTFELSTLPHEHAGNPYTYFTEVSTMSNLLKPEVREYLVRQMGEEKVTDLEQVVAARDNLVEESGAQYRNFTTRDVESLQQEVTALTARLDEMKAAVDEEPAIEPTPVVEPDTTTTDALTEAVRALTERVNQVDTFLLDKFKTTDRASQSVETIVKAKDSQLQYLNRMNEAAKDKESFVGGLLKSYGGQPNIQQVTQFPTPPAAPEPPTTPES